MTLHHIFISILLLLAGCVSASSLQDFDGDGSLDQDDCEPSDPNIYPGAEDPYGDDTDQDCDGSDGIDRDDDGFPVNVPVGSLNLDCNDERADIYPGAADPLDDPLDSNCDGHPGVDADGDGYANSDIEGTDCNDSNANVHPGASDNVGDVVDSNCDGHDGTDNDGDGSASLNSEGDDCDDGDPLAFPGNSELCDGIDNDCSGAADEPFDQDLDAVTTCGADGVLGTEDDDCDDSDPTTHPNAIEQCDLSDNDCDGTQPADETDGDADGDPACSDCDDEDINQNSLDVDADGYSPCGADGIPDNGDEDCDDLQPTTHPGAQDQWGDLIDTDCDGIDGIDLDGDGWAVNAAGALRDCDDAEATTYPTAADNWGDSNDSNCDGIDGEDYDNDGWPGNATNPGADCNDSGSDPNAPLVFPGAADIVADGIDNNCDGIPGTDNDSDGFASSNSGGNDCDDDSVSGVSTYPGAADSWGDGTDSNCDGVDGEDADGDGFAGNALETSEDFDCDDSLTTGASTYPTAADNWGDGEDTNCDGADGVDDDGDSFAGNAGGFSNYDCDDGDSEIFPGSVDMVDSSGEDTNCDGADGVDADGDLHASIASGGDDCNDSRNYVYPGAADPPGNGIDEDCDNCSASNIAGSGDGIDTDCDGWALNGAGSTQDCDDTNPDIFPGSPVALWDSPGLQIDINCDGDFITLLDVGRSGDFQCEGHSSGEAGSSIAFAGDIDSDGSPDLLIGAPQLRVGTLDSAGSAYLVLNTASGSANPPDIPLNSSIDTVRFEGDQSYQFFGASVATLGDLDGGLIDDIAISGRDSVFIFLGERIEDLLTTAPPSGLVLQSSDADITLSGPVGSYAGMALAGGEDFDADGIPDLLIGAPGSPTDGTSAGVTFLIDGGTLRTALGNGLRNVDMDTVGISLVGAAYPGNQGEHSGQSVAFVETTSSDPYVDVLIGAPTRSTTMNGNNRGGIYLLRGQDLLSYSAGDTVPASIVGIKLTGSVDGGLAGSAVASAGDVNGDGAEDILIGAPETTIGSNIQAGSTYLVLAEDLRVLSSAGQHPMASVAQYTFHGEFAGDKSGSAVATAGDVDADGLDDMLIGAPHSSDGGTYSGKTYLILGNQLAGHGGQASVIPFPTVVGEALSQAKAAFSGSFYTRSGSTVAGGADINSDGRDDLLIGAPTAISDAGVLYAGKVYVLHAQP